MREGWAVSIEMLYSMGYAAFAGYAAALVAHEDEVTHAAMIAVFILTTEVINILVSPAGIRPAAYEAVMLVFSPIAAVLGGVIRSQQRRATIADYS